MRLIIHGPSFLPYTLSAHCSHSRMFLSIVISWCIFFSAVFSHLVIPFQSFKHNSALVLLLEMSQDFLHLFQFSEFLKHNLIVSITTYGAVCILCVCCVFIVFPLPILTAGTWATPYLNWILSSGGRLWVDVHLSLHTIIAFGWVRCVRSFLVLFMQLICTSSCLVSRVWTHGTRLKNVLFSVSKIK